MDLVINSQIQSPLVRTLARTKGKSQSFTHNIPDNVPPCSFSKIVIAPQNGTTKFGSTYKLKIPQYGYLRDVILKYTTQENVIPASVASIVQRLYSFRQFVNLGAVQALGSYEQGVLSTGVTNVSASQLNPNFSWFNCQKTVGLTVGAAETNGRVMNSSLLLSFMQSVTPQFSQLYHMSSSTGALITAPAAGSAALNGGPSTLGAGILTDANGAILKTPTSTSYFASTGFASNVTTYTTNMVPELEQFIDSGDAEIWSAFMTLWYNIYLLAQNDTSSESTGAYKIAKLVLNELQSLPPRTISMPIYSSKQVAIKTSYVMKSISGTAVTVISNNDGCSIASPSAVTSALQYTQVTLPGWIKAVTKGERIILVPRVPTLVFDDNGKVTGCQFTAMDLMHPQDNAATYAQTFLGQLQSSVSSESQNNRVFAFENSTEGAEEWNMWDWQTDTFRYPLQTANLASNITLTTHNRPVQTVFPRETVARINRMGYEDRLRYLKMMEPRISQEGKVGASGNAGSKVQYFPLFLASTENPSLNFDTRFVEQLDLDVAIQPYVNSHVSSDVAQAGASAPLSIPDFVRLIVSTLFDAQVPSTLSFTNAFVTTLVGHSASPTGIVNYADLYKNGQNSSYITSYVNASPRDYVLSLRNYQNTFQDYIKVEALLYYHNFHDGTSQAIRDSNFKPGTPASLLMYNTYQETERLLTQTELQNTKEIIIQLTTNNLVFGTTFLVRRRNIADAARANKLDHLMNTLPIKKVTLTGSGQQLYTADLDETQLTDAWDYDLASGKVGRKYNNGVMIQAIDDPVTGDSFHLYYIPYSFSSDMTYNSGSVAFQTINNPVLTLVVDAGVNASQPFNINSQDGEYSIEVYHNYWNMVRIDSNTGAITKSLDL
jgi:hypothetical protein